MARCRRGRKGCRHGGLSWPAKPRFLVATTVIEVGVDVPNASIMVIERAESYSDLRNCISCAGGSGADRPSLDLSFDVSAPVERDRAVKSGWRYCARPRTVFASPRTDLADARRGRSDRNGAVGFAEIPHCRSGTAGRAYGRLRKAGRPSLAGRQDPRLDPSPRGQAARLLLLWLMKQDQGNSFDFSWLTKNSI